MGGSSKKTESSSSTSPWAPQQPYLIDAFAAAKDNYDTNMSQGAYSGDYVAPPSQQQYDVYGNAVSTGYNNQDMNNGVMAQGAQTAKSGAFGASGALNNLAGFASADPTAGNINKANQYAAGMDIPGAVKAGMFQANQNAATNDIPNLYRQAASAGGLNSDRAALSQGVVERGLAEQSAGLSAQMHNAAYTTGLSNAQQGNAQQLQADSQLGSLGLGMLSQGDGAVTTGINNQANINNQITGGANGITGLNQSTLNNLMAKYNGGQEFSTQQLQNLMAIIGKSFGTQSSGTSTTTNNPSILDDIGSVVGIGGKLMGMPGGGR